MHLRIIAITIVSVVLGGCANTAEHLRSHPVTYFPVSTTVAIPDELKDLIKLSCMREQDTSFKVNGADVKECLYISADASNLTNTIKGSDAEIVRDKALSFLTSISDMNCSNFLQRAFANKAGLNFSKGFISDLSTGVSAGTAHTNPAVASALSISNLIVGKGIDSFNTTYYFDKTFQALEAALAAERSRIKTYIVGKQAQAKNGKSTDKYEIVQALSDIRAYDDACSIKAGLAQLVQLADTKKKLDEQNKVDVELAIDKPAAAKKALGNPTTQ